MAAKKAKGAAFKAPKESKDPNRNKAMRKASSKKVRGEKAAAARVTRASGPVARAVKAGRQPSARALDQLAKSARVNRPGQAAKARAAGTGKSGG